MKAGSITIEYFTQATGHPPKDDDMERANCLDHGRTFHVYCGWCEKHDKPRFECIDCFAPQREKS